MSAFSSSESYKTSGFWVHLHTYCLPDGLCDPCPAYRVLLCLLGLQCPAPQCHPPTCCLLHEGHCWGLLFHALERIHPGYKPHLNLVNLSEEWQGKSHPLVLFTVTWRFSLARLEATYSEDMAFLENPCFCKTSPKVSRSSGLYLSKSKTLKTTSSRSALGNFWKVSSFYVIILCSRSLELQIVKLSSIYLSERARFFGF